LLLDPLPQRSVWLALTLVSLVLSIAACSNSNAAKISFQDDIPSPTKAPVIKATVRPISSEDTVDMGVNSVAKDGDTALVHYHGTLDNGEVFDSSLQREPLTFILGSGQVIPGFDDAVRGLAINETVTVRLQPEFAYGERREDLIFEIPISQAPQGLLQGDNVRLANGQPATILEVSNKVVSIDANHRLAGEALTFNIQLISIQ
jgi:FKBP-type peptidyl-prolyl cis-trans isomerase 2